MTFLLSTIKTFSDCVTFWWSNETLCFHSFDRMHGGFGRDGHRVCCQSFAGVLTSTSRRLEFGSAFLADAHAGGSQGTSQCMKGFVPSLADQASHGFCVCGVDLHRWLSILGWFNPLGRSSASGIGSHRLKVLLPGKLQHPCVVVLSKGNLTTSPPGRSASSGHGAARGSQGPCC